MPKKKDVGGRPSVVTDEVIRKLYEAFSYGCTDLEACFYADIGKTALYEYQKRNPDFAERKEALKNQPNFLARRNTVLALQECDTDTSKWYLSHKLNNEFNTRSKVDGNNELNVNIGGYSEEMLERAGINVNSLSKLEEENTDD